VIFAGTRDRKPNGMAEVSLTLINPEEYDGADANEPTEVEIQEEMPADDWDEAEVRARAAEETERVSEELQPGVVEGDPSAAKADGDQEQEFAALKRCATQELSQAVETINGGGRDARPTAGEDAGATDHHIGPAVVLKIRRRKFQQQ